jgi:hypothetical protein
MHFPITYVTHYFVQEGDYESTREWSIDRLRELIELGIPLIIYISQDQIANVSAMTGHPHVTLQIVDPGSLEIHQIIHRCKHILTLPENRHPVKDSWQHMWKIHCKVELLNHASNMNPWSSTHFAWIDYNITYLFCQHGTSDFLRFLNTCVLTSPLLLVPGCKEKGFDENNLDSIQWRFCGAFVLGDKTSIRSWFSNYITHLEGFLLTYRKLVWEVVFWAWLENAGHFSPHWYYSGHDDRLLLSICPDIYAESLEECSQIVYYTYPEIVERGTVFYPMSASYHCDSSGKKWLNTRFINYRLSDSGYYIFQNQSSKIENINVLSELDDYFLPKSFSTMIETLDVASDENRASQGLEDLRIFENNGSLQIIGTTMNYSPVWCNQMVVADYDPNEYKITGGKVVRSPREVRCEKNWIPVGNDLFIYGWCPFEIGKIVDDHLEIMTQTAMPAFFKRIRGSTTFIKTESGLLGVVHFSEECKPRHYYHMLILLDSESFLPLVYSRPFYFSKHPGIEFCLGFTEHGDNYLFWISVMDRDPRLAIIPKKTILLENKIAI